MTTAILATIGALFGYQGGATQNDAAMFKNNAAIAKTLFMSDRAVEKHIGAVFQKLGLETEVERLSARKVPLPSGANFVIDQTEAVTAIEHDERQ